MLSKFDDGDLNRLLDPQPQPPQSAPVISITEAAGQKVPSKDFTYQQIQRFRSHRKFPGKEGQRELVIAFRRSCSSNEEVAKVIDHLIQFAEFAPVPADIHRAAQQILRSCKDIVSPRAQCCSLCFGTGWISSTVEGQQAQAKRCRCNLEQQRIPEQGNNKDQEVIELAKLIPKYRAIAEKPAELRAEKIKQKLALDWLADVYREHPEMNR